VLVGRANAGKSTILEGLKLLLGVEQAYRGEDLFTRYDIYGLTRERGLTVKIGAILEPSKQEWAVFPELEEPYADLPSWAEGPADADLAGLDEDPCILRVALFYQPDRPEAEDRAVWFFPKFDPPGQSDCRRVAQRQRQAFGFWDAPYNEALWEVGSLSTRSQLARAARAAGWDPRREDRIPAFIDSLVAQAEGFASGSGSGDGLNELASQISKQVGRLLPSAAGDIKLGITAAVTEAWAQRMMELGFGESGQRIPLSRQGAGMQRAIAIAARAAFAEIKAGAEGVRGAQVLTIDEPEVGLHAQAQRTMLHGLAEGIDSDRPQAFIATHSADIVQACRPQEVWRIDNRDGELTARTVPSEAGCVEAEQVRKNAQRYWDVCSSALFARAALVVEGSTEAGALPVFDCWAAKTVGSYRGLDAADVALISAGGITDIAPIARVLRSYGIKVVALYDLDPNAGGKGGRHADQQALIERVADLAMHWPDEDPGRDFEGMMTVAMPEEVLRRVLTAWSEIYVPPEGGSFGEWVRKGLPRHLGEHLPGADGSKAADGAVIECVVNLCGQARQDVSEAVRDWFADRCRGKRGDGTDDQHVFAKSARYGRIWAQACVDAGGVPPGIRCLFENLHCFITCSMTASEGRKIISLSIR
jgi:hypothetical protein